MSRLLEPEFLRRLELLRRSVSSAARSGGAGEHRSRRHGRSGDFREHRTYAAGDDPRRIDWNATARTGHSMLKLFHDEEDRVVRLILDGSASLGFGSPSKFWVGQRVAAAVAYLCLTSSERAQVWLARNTGSTAACGLGPIHRGRAGFAGLCRELEEAQIGGQVHLNRALDHVLTRAARPGLLVVLSDFFDDSPYLDTLARAHALGHELALFQILSAEELDPPYAGDLALEDAETGNLLALTADATAIDAYIDRLQACFNQLGGFARRHAATYVRLTTTDDLEAPLRRWAAAAID